MKNSLIILKTVGIKAYHIFILIFSHSGAVYDLLTSLLEPIMLTFQPGVILTCSTYVSIDLTN